MEISTEPIEALPATFVDALAAAWVQEGPAARRRLVEAIDGAYLLPDDMVLVSGWAVTATNLAAAVGQEDTQPYRVLRASRAMGRTIALAESGEMVLEEVLQQFWARLSDIYAECAEQHGVGLLPAIRGTRTLALVAARSSAQALEAFREQRLAMAGRPADRLLRRLVGERREPRAAERAAAALGLEAGRLWVTVGRPPEGVQLGASDARAPRLVPTGPRAQTVPRGAAAGGLGGPARRSRRAHLCHRRRVGADGSATSVRGGLARPRGAPARRRGRDQGQRRRRPGRPAAAGKCDGMVPAGASGTVGRPHARAAGGRRGVGRQRRRRQ
ncbi:hypothetical protein [Conexibacter sp. W3-3-2]|uniref:hypothetical protein n=1 Tax=Conexibacter sp. W3-3-2 TaxID=2675227 RepID=UPI0018A8B746|nr:hypothetical protein [Conexibacter sp. W3-3-2]